MSPHVRTQETAGHLGLAPDQGWMENDLVRERDWGDYSNLTEDERDKHFPLSKQNKGLNAWYWAPPGGESLAAGVRLRFERLINTLHREMEARKLIIVTHGEFMWVGRFVLERMDVKTWLEADDDKSQRIRNTMVLQYSRRDPDDEERVVDKISWARAVCPWDESLSVNDGEWWEVERKTFSDEELLEYAGLFPRLLGD